MEPQNQLFYLECLECKERYSPEEIVYVCRRCGNILDVKYDYREVKAQLSDVNWKQRPLSVWRYKEFLPIRDESKIVTLNEGGTSLYDCKRLSSELGIKKIYIKVEGGNPTGSFKDRGMTLGVTKALEFNAKIVACASTGNTSASLAAYASKADIRCLVIIPSGKIAYGKLAQSIIYGAQVIQIKGNFDEALEILMELSIDTARIYLLNSVNPYRLEGQKTLAYEVVDQLGGVPDRVVVPIGNAGNISAIWKGFQEYKELEVTGKLPKMMGIQAAGAAPIVQAYKEGRDEIEPVIEPDTIATAIRIGSPVSWKKALRAIRQSKGLGETVTDHEIVEAQRLLARREGLFVEPASASTIAGLKKLLEARMIDRDETVVCVATGHGLKDPDTPIKFGEKPVEVEASLEAVRNVIGG